MAETDNNCPECNKRGILLGSDEFFDIYECPDKRCTTYFPQEAFPVGSDSWNNPSARVERKTWCIAKIER